MDFQYNVSRNYNRINFQNIFGMQFLPSALKEIYDAVVKRSYKDLILDFSGLEAAFADGMVPLCSYVRYIKEEYNVSIEYVAPKSVFGNFSFYSYKKACGQKKTVRGSKNSRRLSNGTPAI